MLSKTKLTMLLGATALGAAGHALAQTNAGTGGTIWYQVTDVTNDAQYMFDTGMTVTGSGAFTGTSNISHTFSGANWTSFLAAISTGSLATTTDTIEYSIVGSSSASSTAPITSDFSGQFSPQTVRTNGQAGTMWSNVNNFLTTTANPSGSDSFQPAGSTTTTWSNGGYETNFNNAAGNTDWQTIGNSLGMFQMTNTSHTGLQNTGATASNFGGTWDLTTAGVLTYTVSSSSVPLPAPLLLLLSGLGLTGLVGRRAKPGSDKTGLADGTT